MNTVVEQMWEESFDDLSHKQNMMVAHDCVFKKCCKKYKRKGRHCKKCPKL